MTGSPPTAEGPDLLDPDTVIDYLRRRGLIGDEGYDARELTGGVSGVVLAVEGESGGYVVKQALPDLRVAAPWSSDPERVLIEARALELARSITPGRVPAVVAVDGDSLTVVMEKAPADAANWRDLLLGGTADVEVAAELGRTLGIWHRVTWLPWTGAPEYHSQEIFEQMRLRPFHGSVAERFPDLAGAVGAEAERLRENRYCLVHGDFSPKNVLVGPDLLWVLDFEVAHIGHPIFDLAFMASAMMLTAIVRPQHASAFEGAWDALLASYVAEVPAIPDLDCLAAQTGCITLNRTDGVSLDPYLDDTTRPVGRELGVRQVRGGRVDPALLWRDGDGLIG